MHSGIAKGSKVKRPEPPANSVNYRDWSNVNVTDCVATNPEAEAKAQEKAVATIIRLILILGLACAATILVAMAVYGP